MSNVKDSHPQSKENVTPHRLAVGVLIREFCKMRDSTLFKNLPDSNRKIFIRDFCLLCLKLIQSPDLQLDELVKFLYKGNFTVQVSLIKMFENTIQSIVNSQVDFLLEIVKLIGTLTTTPEDSFLVAFYINANSVIGYYLRRLVVHFDKLNFPEVILFLESFKLYAEEKESNVIVDDQTNVMHSNWYTNKEQWSRRQAELFIATQAALITHNQEKAIQPKELHKHIKNLLKSNPTLAEAHFLNYLNYLRVNEFCGAVDSLYHCFDRSTFIDSKASMEEKTKSCRFAALNLAILQFQFGHKEEALPALKEAIKMAQEASDNVCLQHALSWLYCLIRNNRGLIEHSILKSLEMSLSYTMSLGIQSFAQFAGIRGGVPKQIFDTMTKSDLLNGQHTHDDLISSSFVQKAGLWSFYGKTEMSSLWSQLLLYRNTETFTSNKIYSAEGYCQAACNVAKHLFQQAEYQYANAIINFAKIKFPNEPVSHIWMMCESLFEFTLHLHHQDFDKAETAAQKMAVVDKNESSFQYIQILMHSRDFHEAHACVNKILSEKNDDTRMDFDVRAMLLLAEIQIATCLPGSVPPGILKLLNAALAYTNDYHLDYLTFMVQLHTAHLQLLIGMPCHALNILDKCLVQVLAHGCLFDRARAMLLYANCIVANSDTKPEEERRNIIKEAAEILKKVKADFKKAEAYYRVKDVLYLLARLYNEIDMKTERNECALEFRLTDEEHPVKTDCSLLKFL